MCKVHNVTGPLSPSRKGMLSAQGVQSLACGGLRLQCNSCSQLFISISVTSRLNVVQLQEALDPSSSLYTEVFQSPYFQNGCRIGPSYRVSCPSMPSRASPQASIAQQANSLAVAQATLAPLQPLLCLKPTTRSSLSTTYTIPRQKSSIALSSSAASDPPSTNATSQTKLP